MSSDPQLSDRPTKSTHYSGDAGATYAEYQSRYETGLAIVHTQRFAPHIAGTDTVLDFGCGTGELLGRLECARKIGIEINPTARERAGARGIETYETTGEVAPGTADVVMSCHALEHTPEPYRELLALREVLKPTGKLVLLLPINDWRIERSVDPVNIDHHLYTWTPLLIGNLLKEAGFHDISAEVWSYALARGQVQLWDRVPRFVFDLTARLAALALRRRHVFVVAFPNPADR